MFTSNTWRRCLPALLAGLVHCGSCVAVQAGERCIVGENVIGCRSVADIDRITTHAGDAAALRDMIAAQIASGACRFFSQGERVLMTAAPVDERIAVRGANTDEAYWMPASWSRPVAECSGRLTRNAPAFPLPASPSAASVAVPADIARPAIAPANAASCEFKPVMSDEEIAACRRRNR